MLRILSLSLLLTVPVPANLAGGGPDAGGPDVSLVDNGPSVTLSNGTLTATITKDNAEITSLLFNGVQVVRPGGNIYYSMDGGSNYRRPSGCAYSVTTSTPDMVDIAMRQTWSGQAQPLDIEVHYVLRRGDTGLYTYALLDHPSAYPAGGYGEWRMVWKLPDDTFENLYVDELRNRRMPTADDYSQASPTSIAEIVHLNTGVLAGQDEGKYCYNANYHESPVYGHASDVVDTGVWLVFGAHEWFNDGPFKQDLAPADRILHVHFGMNHYDGSPLSLAAGEDWTKLYGPFLLYCNADPAGADACWEDAQAQVAAERNAWPYDWLVGNPHFPTAAQRGTVTGAIDLIDPLKPSLDAEGAWVGLAAPDPGGTFQNESERYQHWVRAGTGGTFTIPHVRPGTYTLSCVADGVAGEFVHGAPVTVTAGSPVDLGSLAWNVPRLGSWLAWEIGLPNRDSTEFRHGDDYWVPFIYDRFDNEFPNPLTYDVSGSVASTDWNYAQPGYLPDGGSISPWPWEVNFHLPGVPASGTARLHLAFAGTHYARMYVDVNGSNPIGGNGFFYPAESRGNALLRQSSHAKYSYHPVDIPVSMLTAGANTIRITQGKVDDISMHAMYDYVALELPTLPGGNPADGDGDGLTDSWETLHFRTLSPTAAEDPDADGFTNAEEEAGNSDPNDPASQPLFDADGDLLPDPWELFHYPALSSAAPLDDTDGDGWDTWTEWMAGTDPTDGGSAPGSTVNGSETIGASADTSLFHRDGDYAYNNTNYGSAPTLDAGQFGGGIWSLSYLRFDLAALPDGATIEEATFRILKTGGNNIAGFPVSRSDTWTTGRFGTYGLLDVGGNTSQSWDELSLTGDGLGAELVQGINPQFDTTMPRTADLNDDTESISNDLVEVSGPALAAFLQDRLAAPADPGLATLIVDFMDDSGSAGRGFTFVARENGGLQGPTLVIDYSATNPVPDPDADADGLDDAWEAHHLGTLASTGDGDKDGDGTPDWAEFHLALDPDDPKRHFSSTVVPGDGALQLRWPNGAGVTFTIQSSPTLQPGSWDDLTTITGTTDPGPLSHPISTEEARLFLRVVAAKP